MVGVYTTGILGMFLSNICNNITAAKNMKHIIDAVYGDISHPPASSPVIFNIFGFLLYALDPASLSFIDANDLLFDGFDLACIINRAYSFL